MDLRSLTAATKLDVFLGLLLRAGAIWSLLAETDSAPAVPSFLYLGLGPTPAKAE